MRSLLPLLAGALLLGFSIEPALSAIKFKRFPHCPEGLVSAKTCECHAGESGRFHYCHAGNSCDTVTGKCHK